MTLECMEHSRSILINDIFRDWYENEETREVCKKLVTLGKFGLAYMGVRAIGQIAGIGPEFDAKQPMILDSLGVTTAYVGAWSYLSEKILKRDGKELSNKLEKALEF